jgi:hypothetical protein
VVVVKSRRVDGYGSFLSAFIPPKMDETLEDPEEEPACSR